MSNLVTSMQELDQRRAELHVQEGIMLDKALKSDDPTAVVSAMKRLQDVEQRQKSDSKSFVFDPLAATTAFGYRNKPVAMSYDLLRRMAKAPLIRAIIGTRQDQVAEFAQPQTDKYSCGFIIRRKQAYGMMEDTAKAPNKADAAKIKEITEFMLNGGSANNAWHGDSFDMFIRKFVKDLLELDQATFEVVRNRRGLPVEFFSTDAATFRIADSYDDDDYIGTERQQINGYYPSYVQVLDSSIKAEFYPWEMCFAVRNPSSSIYSNGYGSSELEDLIMTVTAMLHSDQYNSNFFKVGSAPKGILKVTQGVTQARLDEFRQSWYAQVAGVQNSHKLPVIDAEKMDFLNLQMSNRDMEFAKYQEYLIKVACSMYKIDPDEIGFKLGGSDGQAPLFEGGNAARLKYSRDKGLRPILRHVQAKLNKYIVSPLDPNFELVFVGLDTDTAEKELDMDIKKAGMFMTLDEMRAKYGLGKMKEKDVVLNSVWAQLRQQDSMNAQNDQQDSQGGPVDDGDSSNDDSEDDNPFLKSLNEWSDKTFGITSDEALEV